MRKRVCVCVCVSQGAYSLCFAITLAVFFVAASRFWKQSLSSRLHSSGFFWAISCCDELLVEEEVATTGFCFLSGFFAVY